MVRRETGTRRRFERLVDRSVRNSIRSAHPACPLQDVAHRDGQDRDPWSRSSERNTAQRRLRGSKSVALKPGRDRIDTALGAMPRRSCRTQRPRPGAHPPHVVIVGGGFSGATAALQLVGRSAEPVKVTSSSRAEGGGGLACRSTTPTTGSMPRSIGIWWVPTIHKHGLAGHQNGRCWIAPRGNHRRPSHEFHLALSQPRQGKGCSRPMRRTMPWRVPNMSCVRLVNMH